MHSDNISPQQTVVSVGAVLYRQVFCMIAISIATSLPSSLGARSTGSAWRVVAHTVIVSISCKGHRVGGKEGGLPGGRVQGGRGNGRGAIV